ncbi:hypothetical protein Avbf_01559 [Armadillidium vulgare]|nr:hypothetical protein Avbf_01559 [Armadillidium vulgare]
MEEEKVSGSPPESGLAEEVDEGEEDSESGEEEFTPSTWNSELTPNRSLLKSPETNSVSKLQSNKKSVHWKRQRHHRVYEYPPEPYSWHAEVTAPTPRRSWNSTHSLDYLTLAGEYLTYFYKCEVSL